MTRNNHNPILLSMKGNVYTSQKCSVCAGRLEHDERRAGLFCREHPASQAMGEFYVKYGRQIRKRFSGYAAAVRFLTGLRFKDDEGTLDSRDYRADNPLSFSGLGESYLGEKKHLKSFRDAERMIQVAQVHFGDRNVKSISGPDIKHFLRSLTCGNKTKANYLAVLHNFFAWYLVEEEIIQTHQVPKFPKIEYELGWRRLTDWATQDAILREIKKVEPMKAWLAIDLLRTYTTLRPGDIRKIDESDIDAGTITLLNPTKTKNKRKVIRLVPEHVSILQNLKDQYPALPGVKFFRHDSGDVFGVMYLYNVWIRACKRLGIEGLDLYGGTRHTTTTELAKLAGSEAARDASGHETNRAFERYCQVQNDRAFQMAQLVISRDVNKKRESC